MAETKNISQSIQDAGYIAVGVGVLGVQAAQVRRREAQKTLETGARDVKSAVENAVQSARGQIEPVVAGVRERVEPLVSTVTDRIEPVVGQIHDKAREVVEVGSAKAKVFLGKTEPKPAAKTSASKAA
jgi:gas vesicle protein